MNAFASKFTIYETLRIVLPGTYGTTVLVLFFNKQISSQQLDLTNFHLTIIFLFVSFLLGVFVYSIDIPKRLSFLKKKLPSVRVEKEFPHISKEDILNSYFDFYNGLSAEQKQKTEVFSGLYHFCTNIASIALILGIFFRLYSWHSIFSIMEVLNLSVCLLSMISAISLYHSRLKVAFERHYRKFLTSNEYLKLTQ